MAAKKKTLKEMSLDEVVTSLRSNKGKDFETRIGALESFYAPENLLPERISAHVDYVIEGKEGDKAYPGAYRVATGWLHKKLKNDTDKLTEAKHVDELLDTYITSFLESHIGGSTVKKRLAELKKDGVKDDDLKRYKAQWFSRYTLDRNMRDRIDVSDPEFKKRYIGKSKVEILTALKGLVDANKRGYAAHIQNSAIGTLFDQEDELPFGQYVHKKFKKAGLTHEDHPLSKGLPILLQEYSTYLRGGDMSGDHGYRKAEPKEKK